MTQEIKIGDKVRLKGADSYGIVRYVGEETCTVDFGLGESTIGHDDIEIADLKTKKR